MYRKLLIDDQENCWTIIVQVKKWYGWVTVKEFIGEDLQYVNLCAIELLDKLNEVI